MGVVRIGMEREWGRWIWGVMGSEERVSVRSQAGFGSRGGRLEV